MNDSTPETGPENASGSAETTSPRPRPRQAFALVPAATFLVGLFLGAVLVWAADPAGTNGGSGEEAASPTPTPTTSSPTPPAETSEAIVVPSACVDAAQAAGNVVRLVRDAAGALGDLDTVRLQEILDELERLDQQIRQDASRCRPESSPEAPASPSPQATASPSPES